MKRIKLNLSTFLFVVPVLFYGHFFGQDYSYKDFLDDNERAKRMSKYITQNKPDSVKTELNGYENRLGFSYFQFKAFIAKHESDSNNTLYIDSAFMRGMTPLCLGPNLKKYDSTKLYTSFRKNYLKAYDPRLINLIDSIHYKDQFYRQQITNRPGSKQASPNTKKKTVDPENPELISVGSGKDVNLLWQKQKLADSTNLLVLNKIIKEHGWPGARLVGDHYCQRSAPDVTLLVMHLGTRQRPYQLEILKEVIVLCKKNEESWAKAESLIFNLHSRFRTDFSEFCLLDIENNSILPDESFFSIYNMSKLLMKRPDEKIVIKCRQFLLFEDLKSKMLAINNLNIFSETELRTYAKVGWPIPVGLDESRFEFISSPELNDNVILYKFEKK